MQINDTPDIISIYDNFIKERNAVNSENRYKGNEHWYHASSAGMCRRKIYYASVEQAEQTNPPEPKAYRLMRLGTIVHNDIQKGLKEFAKETIPSLFCSMVITSSLICFTPLGIQ